MSRVAKKSDALYQVISCIRPLFLSLKDAVEVELEGTGVTVAMRAVLEQLSVQGAQPVPAIARSLNIKRQSVQVVVDELLANHFVERIENPAHRKSWLIKLTSKGSNQIRNIRTKEQSNLNKVCSGLSKEEINTCLRVMTHMQEFFSDPDKWRAKR